MDYSYFSSSHSQQPPFSLYGINNGLPTPDQNRATTQADDLQDTFPSMDYQPFDPSFRFQNPNATSPFVLPPHSPPESFSKHSVSSNEINNLTDPASVDGGDDQLVGEGRSSSEEKDSVTPAQSKRKAQNRAAQRAFRERKERHVRELEEKVNNLEQESTTLMADNERLKRELAKFATENEVLRATSNSFAKSNNNRSDSEPTMAGPMKYSPTDFYPPAQESTPPSHRVTTCEITGERLLDTGATWDFIQSHELYKQGLVDIEAVSNRLKGLAQCNGNGPAFREGQVLRAIEESTAAGRDELI